jgi:hypothetical protein
MVERYGADTQVRIGLQADVNTAPTVWWNVEFLSFALTPTRDRKERPKIGAARRNQLDPIKPRPGFLKLAGSLVLDADTRQLPIWLRVALGAPVTETGPVGGIYTHAWETGKPDQVYFTLQLKGAASQVRVVSGCTLATLAAQVAGENVQDFDINLGIRALSKSWSADWLSGVTTNALPTEAPISRALFKNNGTAVANTMNGSWSWDRKIQEDAFLSTTPNLAALRAGAGTGLTGSATFRDDGEAWDTIEEADTVIVPTFALLGVVTGHEIDLAFPNALLKGIPLEIPTPDLIQRTINFEAFQTSGAAGATVTVKNDVATYAA